MTQQIAVCPGLFPAAVNLERTLPAGKRNGTVQMRRFEFRHDTFQLIIPEARIFAALQDDRAEAQFISVFSGSKYLFFGQAVAADFGIARADAAVITVVFAEIGEFDQSAEENPVTVKMAAHC